MKNKKLLYVLIPATLLVWGMILYKIFNNIHAEENTAIKHAELTITTNEVVNDTFSIHPTYRDPFLGKMNKNISSANSQPAKPVLIKPVKVVPVAVWPKIIYGGIIKNQKSNKQLALIQIDGQGYTMKPGETINDIQLTKIFRDSIEVKFLKEKKFVSK